MTTNDNEENQPSPKPKREFRFDISTLDGPDGLAADPNDAPPAPPKESA